jgi:hypothetical protein
VAAARASANRTPLLLYKATPSSFKGGKSVAVDKIILSTEDQSFEVEAAVFDRYVEQLSFSFHQETALDYMRTMFDLEAQRDELNEAINDARTSARERGVPTKAVEAAVRAAKGRRKAALHPDEFRWLMEQAEQMLPREDEL